MSVIPLKVPLRERRDDVELLANYFLKKYAGAAQKSIFRIQQNRSTRRHFEWPGNVRQLENTIERAVAMETSEELKVDMEAERPRARAAAAATNGNGSV